MERMLCPRVHFKCIIVDGVKAYFGSANLTGAGMGAKSEKKRNFENRAPDTPCNMNYRKPGACPKGNCRGYVRWVELG